MFYDLEAYYLLTPLTSQLKYFYDLGNQFSRLRIKDPAHGRIVFSLTDDLCPLRHLFASTQFLSPFFGFVCFVHLSSANCHNIITQQLTILLKAQKAR